MAIDGNGNGGGRADKTLFVVGDADGKPIGVLTVNDATEFEWSFDENVSVENRTGAVAELMAGQLFGLDDEMILTTMTALLVRMLLEITNDDDERREVLDKIHEIAVRGISH